MAEKPIQKATPEEKKKKYPKPEFKPEQTEKLPPLTDDGRPASTMQKIERAHTLPPGAAEALGGAPFRAPIGNPAARVQQALPAVEIPRTGNPTFDAPPPEVVARREHIAKIKESIAKMFLTIQVTVLSVRPHLDALAPEAALVREKEDFVIEDVEKFFTHLQSGIDGLKKSEPKPADSTKASKD